ncbi:c-type cytochrome [bacterium]|nr:c-type cytochrome [bacterium]
MRNPFLAFSLIKKTWLFAVIILGSMMFQGLYAGNGMGESTYNEHCSGCHGGGFLGWLSGAPEIGNMEEWKPFFEKGVEKMKANALKGVGRMDPKGGCDKCSDEDVEMAVDYILSKTPQ